jgi:hypothetical protein
MLKKYTLFFLALIFSYSSYCQNMNIVWQKVIGGIDSDAVSSIVACPNNSGYYLFGGSNSNASGEKSENSRGGVDLWLVKTDNYGDIEWEKTIGGSDGDNAIDALILNDTLFLLSRSNSDISGDKTTVNYGSADIWLLALDLDGTILFQQNYGGNSIEFPKKLTYLKGNSLLISSESSSGANGNKSLPLKGGMDVWVLEIDKRNGSILSQFSYGTSEFDEVSRIVSDDYGNIYIMAASNGTNIDKTAVGNGSIDIWLIKLDENFNEIDQKCFGGNNTEYGSESDILIDGDYIYFVCSSQSDVSGNKTAPRYGSSITRDYWLVKLDLDLNIVWDRSFGGTNTDQSFVLQKSYNKIVIGGFSRSAKDTGTRTSFNYGETDIWMVIVDENGNEIAQQSYGGSSFDSCTSFIEDGLGNLIIAGTSQSPISGNKTLASKGGSDYWLLKINAIQPLNTINHKHTIKLSAYPNPTSEMVEILSNEPIEAIEIFDITGKVLYNVSFDNLSNQVKLNVSHLTSGVYFVKASSKKGNRIIKLVIE